MMHVERTDLPEVRLYVPPVRQDNRGGRYLSFSADELRAAGVEFSIAEEFVYSIARRDTLYGIHFQNAPQRQAKLVSLLAGSGVDYVVDLRRDSPSYCRWIAREISAAGREHVLVPSGFGHVFRSLEDNVMMLFRVDTPFDLQYSRTISYRDPQIALDIREREFLLSEYDAAAPVLAQSDCNL
jgi:dTDP-4-dehydrorhamnose 3,5-epimerase